MHEGHLLSDWICVVILLSLVLFTGVFVYLVKMAVLKHESMKRSKTLAPDQTLK